VLTWRCSTLLLLKLLGHLSTPLTHPTSITARTLTLQLLATMPSLLLHDTAVQRKILKRISADDRDERAAAIEAASAVLPLSPSFRKDVLTSCLEDNSAALCGLLSHAVSNAAEAQQAWTHCAETYERLADDKSAVACVRAMTTLTAAYPGALLSMHGQLLHHVLDQDPRAFVRNFALMATQQVVVQACAGEGGQLSEILEGVFSKFSGFSATSSRAVARLQLSALLLLEKWSSAGQELGDKAESLLADSKKLLAIATDERFAKVYTSIISNIARQKLAVAGSTSPERSLDELLLLLHPRAPVAAKTTWNFALDATAQLSKEFPELLAAYVAPRLVELLSIPADSNVDTSISELRRTSIFRVLGAQLRPPSAEVIQTQLPMLLQELSTVKRSDTLRLRAVAATFFLWTREIAPDSTGNDTSANNVVVGFERQLLSHEHYESHAERYEMAKLAMLRGRFTLASQLMEVIAAKTDSECFGGWLYALQTLCEAEARIASEQSVHLESLHSLARTRMYLQAARTSSFRFDLQLHLVALRLEWVQLLQSAQQLAGEAAYTNTAGNPVGREGQLSKQLRALAHQFGILRSELLGADKSDLEVLQAHANSCHLLAAAVEGFLLLRSPNSTNSSQWGIQLLKALIEDVRGKLERVAKLSPPRQPGVGARVLQQLLVALCAVPPVLPKVFFCSRLRSGQRLLSSAQFLTYAENAAFTAKPRSRAQLGVSLGTDFTSVLKGVLALSRGAQTYWRERVEAVEAEVLVCLAGVGGTAVGAVNASSSIYEVSPDEKLVQYRVVVHLPIAWEQVASADEGSGDQMLYLPFQTPVHVQAASLPIKGSFVLMAKLAVVDRQGDKWPLAATGCRRGFIVY